ncbi:MAG: insulinase family protein [Chitinophagaceae bacterium]|nr:MAG: insulinase family protein [Chitinophagaceae bacterium]
MKKLVNYICLALMSLPFAASAQTAPYDMMVNGVKVIVQPSGNDLVVIQTLIKGGVQNYPATKAGIESIAMTALTECGTAADDKNSFKNKLDKVTANVYGYTSMDYAGFNLNCIKSDLETVWPLYTAALLTPKFDEKEFARIKQDAINAIRDGESSPDNSIDKLAKQTAFAGKNYSKDPQGTVAIMEKITAGEAKKYWQSILTKNRMVIVVVGDVDKATLQKLTGELTAKLPAGAKFVSKKESYVPAATTFKPVARENATNYVQGIAGAPLPGSADYNAYNLAMRIFANRHFIEIRTKNGLSYAPGAWFSGGNTPYANLYVTTTDPDKYIAVARALIDKVKSEGFTESELKNEKTGYLTGIHYRNETNEAQAASLASNEIIYGDWKRSIRISDDIKKVTLQQINTAFAKYMTNITWVYQGDVKKVTPALFTQKTTPPVLVEKKAF